MSIEKTCPACGVRNPESFVYCGGCGAKLDGSAMVTADPVQQQRMMEALQRRVEALELEANEPTPTLPAPPDPDRPGRQTMDTMDMPIPGQNVGRWVLGGILAALLLLVAGWALWHFALDPDRFYGPPLESIKLEVSYNQQPAQTGVTWDHYAYNTVVLLTAEGEQKPIRVTAHTHSFERGKWQGYVAFTLYSDDTGKWLRVPAESQWGSSVQFGEVYALPLWSEKQTKAKPASPPPTKKSQPPTDGGSAANKRKRDIGVVMAVR